MEKSNKVRLVRLPLLGLAIVTLLAALWAGLIRLGWNWPAIQPTLPALHGPLMVSGFLGTLISLERAVGLNQRWILGAPLLAGVGALFLVVGAPGGLAATLLTLGSLFTLAALVYIVRLQPALHTVTIMGGGLLWLVGNGLWLAGWSVPAVVPWWMGFLLLTIVGERLELSRILRLSTLAYRWFLANNLLFLAGLLLSLVSYADGIRLSGVALLAQSAWLLRYDIAQRRLKAGGQARFIAISLLTSYIWLGIGGVLALVNGGFMAGPLYDATLHAFFLGFVFSMIFAHAPIIFPAVLALPMRYTPRFYAHLLLLHLTLLLRITGDLAFWPSGRQWGGLLNAVVLLLFLVNTVTSIQRQNWRP